MVLVVMGCGAAADGAMVGTAPQGSALVSRVNKLVWSGSGGQWVMVIHTEYTYEHTYLI